MIIKLVRHGQSLANTGDFLPHVVGDARIGLSEQGKQQAFEAGALIGSDFLLGSIVYCSPYLRTRETAQELLRGASLEDQIIIYEDPRLREAERGYLDEESQHELRKVHGWFYYRHAGGESPADCYDRTSSFLESLMRQIKRHDFQKILIVTHGMTIRCFVMRFLHLRVEQFESMKNPSNCDIITIAPLDQLQQADFACGRWGCTGLRLRG